MLAQLNKPAVQLIIFLVVVIGAGAFFVLQKQQPSTTMTAATGAATAPGPAASAKMGQSGVDQLKTRGGKDQLSSVGQSSHIDKFVVPPPKAEPPRLVQSKPQKQEKPKPPVFPSLVQVNHPMPIKPFVAQAPKIFAPRGTLIKCTLVMTVESNALETPLVGLVSEDVWFQGNLIVPVGTQVQAQASAGKTRDRIDVRGAYTFIWDDGKEYVTGGIALDHTPLPDGTYSLTDGSAGIRGRVLKTDDYAELKILISQALTSVLQSQQSSFQSIYGIVPQNTAANAGLAGGAGASNAYANLLTKKLEKDSEYVQVPAGTQFYIFTTDVFEPELRSIAGLKQGNAPKASTQLALEAHKAQVAEAESLAKADKVHGEEIKSEADLREHEALRQAQMERTRALIAPLQTQSREPMDNATPQPVLEKTP